jgi:hypothetical protein
MASKIWRNLIRTAAAVCFVAGSSAHAGGVFYQSDFDPVGFKGTALWNVDQSCLHAGTYYIGVNSFGSCNVALVSLTVDLWNSATPGTVVTLNFDSDDGQVTPPHYVAGISVKLGELAGVDTFLIGPELGDPFGTGATQYGLQFTSGHQPLPGFLSNYSFLPSALLGGVPAALGNLSTAGVYLWEPGNYSTLNAMGLCPRAPWALFLCEKESEVINAGGYADFITDGHPAFYRASLDTIPEPGSLALLGGALVAGWLTRRRNAAA